MSLRFQISLRVLLLSLVMLFIGGSVAIWQARNAVKDEVDSSINLALQLIKLGLSAAPSKTLDESGWIGRLKALKQTRHLTIEVKQSSDQHIGRSDIITTTDYRHLPPRWFINLVSSDIPRLEHQIKTRYGTSQRIIIQANPLDEIKEAWEEASAFFLTIVLLVLLTFLAVHLVLDKAVRTIEILVDALKQIEAGEFQKKLPPFSTQEYDGIAKAINHLTDVLENTRQQNRALAHHSLQIQEEERQRLSQELHDELGQSLTAIKVMATTAARQDVGTAEISRSIVSISDHLMIVVRSMMQQLHPLMLTELGLKATLEDLIANWSQRNPALAIDLKCQEAVDALDKQLAIQLFRVIQECLTNINRHAEACRVVVELEVSTTNNQLSLQITDDGNGCSIEKINSGFGLLGMRERIQSLNGEFSVQTSPGQGMTIIARVPFS